MTTWTCREADVTCARAACGEQILPGTEMISPDHNSFTPGKWYHPACFLAESAPRGRETPADAMRAILPQLTGRGMMNVPAGRLRVILEFLQAICPELDPVRKADRGKPGETYRKMPGWLREHVVSGKMTPREWAGFWLDHLDIGRCPIIRREALHEVFQFTEERTGEYLVWAGWPLAEVRPGNHLVSWDDGRVAAMAARARERAQDVAAASA